MRRLVLQPSARKDLGEVLRYLARQSGSIRLAMDFTNSLRGQCRNLASLPGTLGRPGPDLGADVRSFAIRGYNLVFRYGPGLPNVLAIIQGHCAPKPSLLDPTDGTPSA